MKKIIDKLNFNIDEFKNNYWYSKTIEIPQFIKNIEPNISEIDLFNKLLFNVFQTCDLFINQKMSQFLTLDLTLEQIIEILGKQRVSNFICSVYTEIKYRLATEKFPEFSQKDKLITSNFSLATSGREFNNFQSLLSAEAIAYLTYPSWNDLKINKDDYLNITSVLEKLNEFDTKIEKLLKDNSESDENLKISFSKFKSEQLEINNKTKSNIELLEKSNTIAKNIDSEVSALKQQDIDIDNTQKLILNILLNFTNKLIVNNESKLNLGFLKTKYEKDNTQKYNVGDITNFDGKKVYIVKVDDEQTPTTSGGSESNGYTYVFMELNSSKELVD